MMLHPFLRSCSWVMVAAGASGILNIVTTGRLVEKRGPEGKEGVTENNRDDYKHNTLYMRETTKTQNKHKPEEGVQ